jgi:hypothetical protein
MVFAIVELSHFHRANIVKASQFRLDVSHQVLGEHVLRKLRQKIVVGVLDELTQITRKLHRPQVKIVKRLQVLDVVFAVIGELSADILMNAELINVENELWDDLVGAGENLLDDGVVLTAKGNDGFKDVLAANVTCLKMERIEVNS